MHLERFWSWRVKWGSCKQERWNLDPQNPSIKLGTAAHACNPNHVGVGARDRQTPGSKPGPTWWRSRWVGECISNKRCKVPEYQYTGCSLTSTRMPCINTLRHMCTPIHMNMHTCTHARNFIWDPLFSDSQYSESPNYQERLWSSLNEIAYPGPISWGSGTLSHAMCNGPPRAHCHAWKVAGSGGSDGLGRSQRYWPQADVHSSRSPLSRGKAAEEE